MNQSNFQSSNYVGKSYLLYRILILFPNMYITLLSILQGAVLGFLIFSLTSRNLDPITSILIIRSCACFCIIVLVWNEYRMGSTALRWIPNIRDVLIPFFIVIGEVIAVASIKPYEGSVFGKNPTTFWFIGFIWIFLAGLLAYKNMYTKAQQLVDNGKIWLSEIKDDLGGVDCDQCVSSKLKEIRQEINLSIINNETILKSVSDYKWWNSFYPLFGIFYLLCRIWEIY